jgi:hypothetical protein
VSNKYLFTAGSYGDAGVSNDFVIASAGVAEKESAFFRDLSNGGYEFKNIDIKPVVLMDFFIGSIEENSSITSISNFPNPVLSFTTIEFETSQSEELFLEVTDLNGKQVHYQNLGKRVPGKHLIKFETNQLPAGTYIYSIGNEKGKASKSMMVLK